jgi:hypothetical protein
MNFEIDASEQFQVEEWNFHDGKVYNCVVSYRCELCEL